MSVVILPGPEPNPLSQALPSGIMNIIIFKKLLLTQMQGLGCEPTPYKISPTLTETSLLVN